MELQDYGVVLRYDARLSVGKCIVKWIRGKVNAEFKGTRNHVQMTLETL